jgi:hypothetical protein
MVIAKILPCTICVRLVLHMARNILEQVTMLFIIERRVSHATTNNDMSTK